MVDAICKGWESIHNYNSAVNGRIIFCWNQRNIKIRELAEHEQAIHCELLDIKEGKTQQFIAVYAKNTIEQRKGLWRFVQERCANNSNPILIGGDFNTILSAQDRIQGNNVTEVDTRDFAECIQSNGLQEVRAIGSKYTWCNNQDGADRIYSNIDRCLANVQWFSEHSQVLVERLEKSISDHCPQLLKFENFVLKDNIPFRFFNVIADHEEFNQILKKEWEKPGHRNILLKIWFKCKNMKIPFKQVNTQYFRKTSEKVAEIRGAVKEIQNLLNSDHMNQVLIMQERSLLTDLEKWSGIEERIWQQKSRADWIQLGDSNTKFFFAYVKARNNSNAIQLLIKEDGTRCITQNQIQNEVRDFYLKLMGSAATELPIVDKNIVARGGKLNFEQKLQLCTECTGKEVKDALFNMTDNKSPRIDGYNVYFFKRAWPVIGEDIIQAVKQFFLTGFMPKEINMALITLIPKSEKASTVKEFRPIA